MVGGLREGLGWAERGAGMAERVGLGWHAHACTHAHTHVHIHVT